MAKSGCSIKYLNTYGKRKNPDETDNESLGQRGSGENRGNIIKNVAICCKII